MPHIKTASILCALLFLLLAAATPALAERGFVPPPATVLDKGQEKAPKRFMALPYVFKTETLDIAGGVAAGSTGYIQDTVGLFGALMGTSNSSYGIYLMGWNYQLPGLERIFASTSLSYGHYTENRFYTGGANSGGGRAGSNSSSSDNYRLGQGEDNWLELEFRYLLPTGQGKDQIIQHYTLDKGLLVAGATGGDGFNPLQHGLTLFEIKPYYRNRSIDESDPNILHKSSGLDMNLVHLNTDFPANPSKGYNARLGYKNDFGMLDDTESWSFLDGELSGYLDLGAGRFTRQNVLALNAWTGLSPSWEEDIYSRDGVSHRPIPGMGADLGGFWRMRGYPAGRFNDRAVIYYCAELRTIPDWQPLAKINWLKYFNIDWWQFVAFAEAGRVADSWDPGELHSDMKWDAGLGLRLMAIKSVVRLDFAYSEEGLGIWAMVGHPF